VGCSLLVIERLVGVRAVDLAFMARQLFSLTVGTLHAAAIPRRANHPK
jgi:hypothetical protein